MQKVPMTHGRIVIPAPMRKKYGLADGDVVLDDQGPNLRILSVREVVQGAQALLAPYLEGSGSLADSLSEDRRKEAGQDYGNI